MYYENANHCENAMIRLINKHSIKCGIDTLSLNQLVYLSRALYYLEKGEEDKFKHSLTGSLYWTVKNDLEKNGELKSILEYYKTIEELKIKEEI